jgi:N-acetylglutamate synthase-like GNAT family acetyltransferase
MDASHSLNFAAVVAPERSRATHATDAAADVHSIGGFFTSTPSSTNGRQIQLARASDLTYVLHLQKRFSNALGFLPKAALEWYVDHRRLRLASDGRQPCGYVVGRSSLRWNRQITPITQAAVDFDEQRRGAGLDLVGHVENEARQAGQSALQAMCRADLDANAFWRAAGFEEIGRYLTQTARGKEIICWRKCLQVNRPRWFDQLPPVAGHQARRLVTAVQPTLFDYLNAHIT